MRIEPIPGQFVHIDVLVSILAPKLAAVCVEAASGGLVAWLRDKGFEILEVSTADAFELGVNAISLGDERVISTAGSARLNEQLRALGLEVFDPDLSMFTAGGGGAHCLAQALRREPLAELMAGAGDRRRAGDRRPARARPRAPADERGAQRVCWGAEWRAARGLARASCWPRSGSSPRSTRRATSGPGSRAPTAARRRWRSARTSTRSPTAAGSTARSG